MLSKNLASLVLCSTIYLISIAATSLSQQEYPGLDSLITGKKFRVTLYNDKEIIGRVIRHDSLYAFMITESGTVRIKKEDIFSISKNTDPKIIKALFSVGGGLLFQGNYHYSYNGSNNKPGYSLQLTGAVPISETKAVRFDLGFGQLRQERVVFADYWANVFSTLYQTRSVYSLNADVIFSDFSTASDFSLYGLAGLGVLHDSENDYSYTYYSPYDSAYRTDMHKGYSDTYFSMAVGGGMKFKLKGKIGAYIEAQYNIITYAGFFWFLGSGYFPVRAGITYSLY